MITEDYVSFEIAKLLKEKGFDEYGMYFYTLKDEGREGYKSNKRLQEFAHNSEPEIKERAVSCPTHQMAMKWLREKYHIFICILFLENEDAWGFTIENTSAKKYLATSRDTTYESYEVAVEAAIKYCLEKII